MSNVDSVTDRRSELKQFDEMLLDMKIKAESCEENRSEYLKVVENLEQELVGLKKKARRVEDGNASAGGLSFDKLKASFQRKLDDELKDLDEGAC